MVGRRPTILRGFGLVLLGLLIFSAACGGSGEAGWSSARHGVRRTVPLGRSVQGRPIVAFELGNPRAARRVLVVGCVHGDEQAGVPVVDALAAGAEPTSTDLWVVPSFNPDGMAARTRGNARGVDLNRNFPARWRPIDSRGSVHYSGPGPLSEPESRYAADLVRRIRPTIGIWFHQHLAVVDASEGPKDVERRFARDVGLPLRTLTRRPGSITGWENTVVRDSAFVAELPAGRLPAQAVRRYVDAVRRIAGP
ncbi:M14 family zinc carboxypeptidase [Actinomadura mexicana]|uniref:Zinc carboxypeptidase n=1 Tax=Actinomadura mexicana TaxID=134959 RepID=A0A239GZD4_9ACTN|nr:M14 family zinc carboxypeptidase [Actinomadura mexicana]SNS74271.1 Zinc carboxypeptidase [Actinomadura mexicana]